MRDRQGIRRGIAAVALLLAPALLLVLARLLRLVDGATALATLTGCGAASLGGLVSGIIAERLLHRGRNGTDYLIGIVGTTTVSVLTIGFIYLAHMGSPMLIIGTPQRAVQQLLPFTQFLLAQAAGILLLIHRGSPAAHNLGSPESDTSR